MLKASNAVHHALIEISGGRFGWELASMPVLRLTTIGRRSGRPRSVILTSPLRDGDAIVVVASKGGADHHPAWYLNLLANPEVVVETRYQGSQTRWARVATADERARLWPLVTERFSDYGSYQDRTDREIPLVLLEPLTRRRSPG